MAPNLDRGTAPGDPGIIKTARPPIWAEGSQRPKFDVLAFARVADDIARRDLAPVVSDAATRTAALGHRVLAGEWRVTAAWGQRILPSHRRVGAAIMGAQGVLVGAASLLAPPEDATPATYATLVRTAPPPPAVEPTFAEPTLQAIRSALRDVPHDAGAQPQNPGPATTGATGGWLHLAASWVLLRAMMLVALPVGAVKAVLYHLDGGDLRDWS